MTKRSSRESWRPDREHCLPPYIEISMDRPILGVPEIPPTRFFDQLSYIGNESVGCFALETSEGIILLDCMQPDREYIDMIENSWDKLNLDPKDLKAILITHGHGDHYGAADYFRDKYGCKIYMSAQDEAFARAADTPRPKYRTPMPFFVDGHLEDGDVFTLGDTSVYIYATPGHTMGCLSFIFPVYDEGRSHMCALWGGTGIPRRPEHKKAYIESCDYFLKKCKLHHVDAEISQHPFVDNSIERLAVCRNIVNGTPNPYVVGEENIERYQLMFRNMCLARMK